ncbi:helix-turn-helix transcriptional regulator [Ottowia thiooxydans]|uniref:helix-turn-helix transcriptional regulator n=1 Tax=Ottowia thiooxydans TaxID=219182 RepID=UPI00040D0780|nr:AlpA family phage regulatory protein [Ottowia thiooxydans]
MHTVSAPTRHKRPPLQSAYALHIAEALLKIQTVIEVTGLSESSIRRRVAEGTFPAPKKDGKRCTRWVAGQVSDWLKAKGAA